MEYYKRSSSIALFFWLSTNLTPLLDAAILRSSTLFTKREANWTQVGNAIDGQARFGNFGWSVAISADGRRVAAGAPYQDGDGNDSGVVRILQRGEQSSLWEQLGNDITSKAAGDKFGYSVTMSADGNRIAFSVSYIDPTTGFRGEAVRVYDYRPGTASSIATWIQIGNDINGVADGELYKHYIVRMSADGSHVAVGAPFRDVNRLSASGAVRIFHQVNNNNNNNNSLVWEQLGNDINGKAAGDNFGISVAISEDGSRVAVGSSSSFGNGIQSGTVRVFDQPPTSTSSSDNSWIQVGNDIHGDNPLDNFGSTLAMSADGRRIAVGARAYDDGGAHVRVLDQPSSAVSSDSAWIQIGDDLMGDAYERSFGQSVTMSADGSRIAVGTFANDVRVFDQPTDAATAAWIQIGEDINGEAADDQFGFSVAMSADGATLAVGAIRNDGKDDRLRDSGNVRIFEYPAPPKRGMRCKRKRRHRRRRRCQAATANDEGS
jgi:FG-GAP repeat